MKSIYIGLLILAILFGIFAGYYIWGPTWQTPPEIKYDILKDTLAIVLTILAVGITVTGYGIYVILSGRLKNESELASRIETAKGCARLFDQMGYTFWGYYDKRGKGDPQYLEMALYLTERSLMYFNELPANEVKMQENNKLLCGLKNNLAYYYAERQKPEDKDIAKEYAEYIQKKISNYPEEKEAWQDTRDFVKKRYPN